MNKCDLNFVNPVLDDVEIVDMYNNKLIKNFLVNLQKNIKKIGKLLITIQSYTKSPSSNLDYKKFISNII